jgi:hypothetical protein
MQLELTAFLCALPYSLPDARLHPLVQIEAQGYT